MHPRMVRKVAKERFSYLLRVGLARSGGQSFEALTVAFWRSFRAARQREPGISPNCAWIPGSSRSLSPSRPEADPGAMRGMTDDARNDRGRLPLRRGPLVADALQFHRAVRDGDPEGGADGAFDQMDVAAMGADQFGRDRQAKAA